MHWLKQVSHSFFKLNSFLYLIFIGVTIWTGYSTIGWPNNSIATRRPDQWAAVKTFWIPTIIFCFIYLLLSILCFIKKYPAFPLMLLLLTPSLHGALFNLDQVLKQGFIFPGPNIGGILSIVLFILSLIGTVLWIRERFLHK